jgi:hypothetical protein
MTTFIIVHAAHALSNKDSFSIDRKRLSTAIFDWIDRT